MPYFLIVLAVIARVVVHPFNFTPIGAIGLFAGSWCSPRLAWLMPLAALFLSDLIGGFYDPVVMGFVYIGFLGGPLIGRLLLSSSRSLPRFGAAVLLAALFFFLVSNFGMWLSGIGVYPMTAAGLVECYWAGLPYFRVTLLGDMFYAGLLFGSAEVVNRYLLNQGNNELSAG
jgi:hypothetical protein